MFRGLPGVFRKGGASLALKPKPSAKGSSVAFLVSFPEMTKGTRFLRGSFRFLETFEAGPARSRCQHRRHPNRTIEEKAAWRVLCSEVLFGAHSRFAAVCQLFAAWLLT